MLRIITDYTWAPQPNATMKFNPKNLLIFTWNDCFYCACVVEGAYEMDHFSSVRTTQKNDEIDQWIVSLMQTIDFKSVQLLKNNSAKYIGMCRIIPNLLTCEQWNSLLKNQIPSIFFGMFQNTDTDKESGRRITIPLLVFCAATNEFELIATTEILLFAIKS